MAWGGVFVLLHVALAVSVFERKKPRGRLAVSTLIHRVLCGTRRSTIECVPRSTFCQCASHGAPRARPAPSTLVALAPTTAAPFPNSNFPGEAAGHSGGAALSIDQQEGGEQLSPRTESCGVGYYLSPKDCSSVQHRASPQLAIGGQPLDSGMEQGPRCGQGGRRQ